MTTEVSPGPAVLHDDVVGRRGRARHAATRRRRAPEGIRAAFAWCAAAFIISRGVLVLLAWLVPLQPGQQSPGWFRRLVEVGDAGWYLTIAQGGYAHIPFAQVRSQENWPFFPLFPVSTRLIAHALGTDVFWTGLILANASFLLFAVVLFRWVERDWSRSAARVAVALACVCPASAYFTEFRAASLFVLLSTVCLERTVHRHLGQAAVFGALASLTRPTGVLLAVPFLIVAGPMVRERATRWRGLRMVGLGPAFVVGAATMAIVSKLDTGNPLAFEKAQVFWGRTFRLPLEPFLSFARHPSWVSDWGWASPPLALAAAALCLAAAAYLWRCTGRLELAAYLVAAMLFGSASTVLIGFPRFIAEAPPLYLAGGAAPRKIGLALVAVSAAAMIAYTVWWLLGATWAMG